jgi:excisionase family DNA binding protein
MTELLSKQQAAALLGVSVRSIDNYRQSGNLPFHRLPGSRVVRFDKEELERWATGREAGSGDVDQTDKRQQ